jgi:glycyl-tRNA synthetase alpha chain
VTIWELKTKLESFWSQHQVNNLGTWDMEMGAATFHPTCFISVIKNYPLRFMYMQPSRRHGDGKYGLSPNRVIRHHQFQVIINPFTDFQNIQEIYLNSLIFLGLNLKNNDVRFIENDWESTALGAFGVGWEVWINGMEVTQFTFFTKMADMTLNTTVVELAYGMERLCMALNELNSFYHMKFDNEISYKELFWDFECQSSKYYLELQQDNSQNLLVIENNFNRCMEEGLYYPAYEFILQYNKEINLLLAGRFINQIQRKEIMSKMRHMVHRCGKLIHA